MITKFATKEKTSHGLPCQSVKTRVVKSVVRSIQIIGASLTVCMVLTMLFGILFLIADYQQFTSKPFATLRGNPVITSETSRRAERKFGVNGLESKCQEWGTFNDKDGKWWRVKE